MPSDAKIPPQTPKNAAAGRKPADEREERLARALRDNLKKRKAQQRRRQEGGSDGGGTPGGAT